MYVCVCLSVIESLVGISLVHLIQPPACMGAYYVGRVNAQY